MLYTQGQSQRTKQTASPTKYPQGRFNPKKCSACGSMFNPSGPSQRYCTQQCMDWGYTDKYLLRNYKITICQFIDMFEKQSGKCAICGSRGFRINPHTFTKLAVDHCHNTGKVRGLLCHDCNRALGLMHDNTKSLANAVHYLKGATTIP